MTHQEEPRFLCPYNPKCNENGFTETELWLHCPNKHGRENRRMICPICVQQGKSSEPRGCKTWGYSSHLHSAHGPDIEKDKIMQQKGQSPTYTFALVVCRHPQTGKYLLVEEGCSVGWWLPGGRVDPGEHFCESAIRETIEEGGIKVTLKGVIKFEYRAFESGGARQRIILYAEPEDPNQAPKSESDFESVSAVWIGYQELLNDLRTKKKRLRGDEPLVWFKYIEEGGTIYPMDIIGYNA